MEGMTEVAWIAVLAVLCAGLAVGMVSTSAFAWQQWAALRSEQVAREVERIAHAREIEVLRQAIEQTHGKSPARAFAVLPDGVRPSAAPSAVFLGPGSER